MMLYGGARLYIHEVAPRDGLQSEPRLVPTEHKVAFINGLSRTGVAKIEVTSFVSPKAVPTLADAEQVLGLIQRVPGVEYAALVPNLRGCERALAIGVDEINVVMSASESHNRANLRMSCTDSLAAIKQIVQAARDTHLNVSLSTSFGCPFEGVITEARVMQLVDALARLGINRLSLCDTTGMANPAQVHRLAGAVMSSWPDLIVTAHLHNTRGMGLANALAALDAGVRRFDASLGGLGGCPFAPGATGNVCTEDLVHMLNSMGHVTGVDLEALLEQAQKLPQLVGHDVPGQVMKSGPWWRRFERSPGAPQRERAASPRTPSDGPRHSPREG
jgi:hydroxymethylglutaryl-CoA lyase